MLDPYGNQMKPIEIEAFDKTARYEAERLAEKHGKEDAKSDDVSQWPDWKKRAALSNYDFKKEDSE